MRASLLAASSSSHRFESQFIHQIASSYHAPLSHNARKRKTPQRNNPVSYYESDTESEEDYQGLDPEDTIIVKSPKGKKRKVIEVIELDDSEDDSDDIPLAQLSPRKLIPVAKIVAPKESGRAGVLFKGMPTEVRATLSFVFCPIFHWRSSLLGAHWQR
jgi:hypothetical protein